MLVASCGHELYQEAGPAGEGHTVSVKVLRPDGRRVVSYRFVCAQCRERYRREGLSLESPQEAMVWLDGRGVDPRPVERRKV